MEKRCPNCGEVKGSAEYGRNRSLGDGLSFYCLECNREKSNAHYRKRRAAMGKRVRDHSWVPDGFRWCPSCEQPVPHEEFTRSTLPASGSGAQGKAGQNTANREYFFYRRYKLTKKQVAAIRAA